MVFATAANLNILVCRTPYSNMTGLAKTCRIKPNLYKAIPEFLLMEVLDSCARPMFWYIKDELWYVITDRITQSMPIKSVTFKELGLTESVCKHHFKRDVYRNQQVNNTLH